mmetsp:Transcript_17378/g.40402  ORF Transcript_17378/g.40402 Transcript_17378/m.40402 type:complete len:454 (+) Transcript_17378:4780-6141(+)
MLSYYSTAQQHTYVVVAASSSSSSSPPSSELSLPSEYKAMVYGDTPHDPVREQWRRTTTLKRNHAWVQIHAAGLNPVDAKRVIGDKVPPTWTTVLGWYDRWHVSQKVVGYDFCGVLVQVNPTTHNNNHNQKNPSSSDYRPGDVVFGIMPATGRGGSVAEYAQVPLHQLCRAPTQTTTAIIPPQEWQQQIAALPLVGLTALQCLRPHIIKANNRPCRVLVLGASGGTGHIGTQIGPALGAAHVTAVCSAPNADFCRRHGADAVVPYDTQASPEHLVQALREHGPFDVVLDCVTSGDPIDRQWDYPRLIQTNNNNNNYDNNSGSTTDPPPPQPKLLSDDYVYRRLGGTFPDWVGAGWYRLTGLNCGRCCCWFWGHKNNRHNDERLFWIRMHQTSAELQQLATWMEQGKLRPHVEEVYDFTAPDVQRAMESLLGRRRRGKVVVQVAAARTDGRVSE